MPRILITSGPTRQYLDPVRYLTNSSSGQMGRWLAQAALDLGHEVIVVTGPVELEYPGLARRVDVTTTEQMLDAVTTHFQDCDGIIGAAAPCDYRPEMVASQKIAKTGAGLTLNLHETPDVLASVSASRRENQWSVGFALETEDARFKAVAKLQKKHCDLMVLNGAGAMNSPNNDVEIIDKAGNVIAQLKGSKALVARGILAEIQSRLIEHYK
jgi:phosphopantothenoylcysteine decarboxylase / phosphopantothenate---cysteine ligase